MSFFSFRRYAALFSFADAMIAAIISMPPFAVFRFFHFAAAVTPDIFAMPAFSITPLRHAKMMPPLFYAMLLLAP